MIISTTKNRNNIHDNVNLKPIEVQVLNLLKEQLSDVTYKVKSGQSIYTIDNKCEVFLILGDNEYRLFYESNLPSGHITMGVGTGDVKFNSNASPVIERFSENLKLRIAEDDKIFKVLGDYPKRTEEYKKVINEYLAEYFKSDFYTVTIQTKFISNLLLKDHDYHVLDLSANKEIFGDRGGSRHLHIDFEGRLIDYHWSMIMNHDLFYDRDTFPYREDLKDGMLSTEELKRWIDMREGLKGRLNNFNAFDCPMLKELILINKGCYKILNKK